ncbi:MULTISPECIES: hypothetical protein [unclassified Saccharopolyspora]|uniref:effector-associated constant component EACC1 n=1 Tax=unclassified Saccharopolyspora TaxID=2646250 RepID=UPI001CD1F928|nr:MULTISPECIES: hypothetical protein [unclassified Saccharopolyspora]MCA1186745.1 hypothetical protein [Saccharopolyspora sp. 6T]MCA1192989.1 hypothetical protein [Saccharopolyspora sp. 6V]MCA1226593.1 hypothetical protein [Saccharopolyspora sp. 6M]
MAQGTPYRIEVLAGGDPLRTERWTRSLRDDLAELDGLSVGFAETAPGSPGSKGGAFTDLVLAVTALVASKQAAPVLIAAITEWCRRERRRVVRITKGDATLEITGKPGAAQQELVREFLRTFGDEG